MKQDVYTVGLQVVSRGGGTSRVSVSLETRGRSVVKYTSVQLRRVQSTRGVRLRRWRPHSRKVPWKWSWPAIKPSLELPERGSALPSAFQSPPRTGPRSLSRRDDLPRFHTRRVQRFYLGYGPVSCPTGNEGVHRCQGIESRRLSSFAASDANTRRSRESHVGRRRLLARSREASH